MGVGETDMRRRQTGRLLHRLHDAGRLRIPEVNQITINDHNRLDPIRERQRRRPERQIDASGSLVGLRAPPGMGNSGGGVISVRATPACSRRAMVIPLVARSPAQVRYTP